MNFRTTTEHQTYYSLSDVLKEDYSKARLWTRNEDDIYELKQTLFDLYDVENIYIINEFFDKFHYIETIPILFEIDEHSFEELAETQFSLLNNQSIDYYILAGNILYHYTEHSLKEQDMSSVRKQCRIK